MGVSRSEAIRLMTKTEGRLVTYRAHIVLDISCTRACPEKCGR